MRAYFIILSLVSLLFCSCKDELIHPPIRITSNNLNNITLSPDNPSNPYDTIGERHNQILEQVVPQLCGTCQPDIAISTGAVSLATHQLGLSDQIPSFYDSVHETVLLDPGQLVASLNCSVTAKNLLTKLFAVVKDSGTANTDFISLKEQIINLENTANTNAGLNQTDRSMVLAACSVARFSSFYWGFSNPPGKSYSLKGITKWIAAATSDIAGAVITRSASYAADCSSYAYWLIVYSMPG